MSIRKQGTYPLKISTKKYPAFCDRLKIAMDAVKSYVTEGSAAVLAINAGNDMIITSDFETMYSEVLKAVKDGKVGLVVMSEREVDTVV